MAVQCLWFAAARLLPSGPLQRCLSFKIEKKGHASGSATLAARCVPSQGARENGGYEREGADSYAITRGLGLVVVALHKVRFQKAAFLGKLRCEGISQRRGRLSKSRADRSVVCGLFAALTSTSERRLGTPAQVEGADFGQVFHVESSVPPERATLPLRPLLRGPSSEEGNP